PLDVLRVVNRLNQLPGGAGEGEAVLPQGSLGDVDAALAGIDWEADFSDNLAINRRTRRR
ncbi:MAG: hypothetical protein ACK48K_09555, partial [Planctomycetota bacterium]